MAKVTHSRLIEKDAISKISNEFKELTIIVEATTKSVQGLKTVFSETKSVKSAKDVDKLSTASAELAKQKKILVDTQKKIDKLRDRAVKALTEEEKASKRLTKAQSENIKVRRKGNESLTTQRVRTQELNKANRILARQTLGLIKPHERLTKATDKAEKEFKDLAAQFGVNSREARKAGERFRTLDDRLRKVNNAARNGRRDVGRYATAWKGVGRILQQGLGILGITGIIFGLTRAVGGAINRIIGFDKAMQNIAGVTGKTREELEFVEDQIKKVARESTKTSNEVAALAETLFTLGKTPEEVEKLLKPVNDLSIGLEATSEEAGELLIQTLNAFGKGSESAEEYADIIGKIRTSTALDFQKIKDALGFLAPTAKAAGVSFERTGAILGVLADNGIKASRAGRLTSTSFLKLAADGKTLEDALDEINAAQDRGISKTGLLTLTGKLFGKGAAGIGIILANNRGKTDELTKSFENASGALEELTSEQLTSFSARLAILDSAYESFILSVEDGNGTIAEMGKTIIDVVAELFAFASGTAKTSDEINQLSDDAKAAAQRIRRIAETVIILAKVIGVLIAGFIAYKVAVIATNIATKAYTIVTNALRIAQAALSGGLKGATRAMKAFNTASKANIFGILAGLIATVVLGLLAFSDAADEAAESQKRLNEQRERELQLQREKADLDRAEKRSIDDRIVALKTLSKDALNQLLDEVTARKEKLGVVKREAEELAVFRRELDKLDEAQRKINQRDETVLDFIGVGTFEDAQQELTEFRKILIEDEKIRIAFLKNETKAFDDQIALIEAELRLRGLKIVQAEKLKKVTTDLLQIELEKLKAAKAIIAIDEKETAARNLKITGIEKEIKRLRELGEEQKKLTGADPEIIRQIDQELLKRKLLKIQIEQTANSRKESEDETSKEREIRFNREIVLINEEISIRKKLVLDQANFEANSHIKRIEGERIRNVNAREAEEIARIKASSQSEEIKLKQIIDVENRAKDERADIREKSNAEILLIDKTLSNDILKLEIERFDRIKAIDDKKIAAAKATADAIREENRRLLQDIEQELLASIDRRNAATNKRLSDDVTRQEEAVALQRERAANGLENTLADEEARLEKARLKRDRELEEQRKKEELLALSIAFLNQFQSLSNIDPTTALAKAFRNTFLAKAIATTLASGFKEGGYTGDDAVDKVAGVVHGKEFVIDAAETKRQGLQGKDMDYYRKMMSATQDKDLVKSVEDYHDGNRWSFMQNVSNTQSMDTGPLQKILSRGHNSIVMAIEQNATTYKNDVVGMMHMMVEIQKDTKTDIIHYIDETYNLERKRG